ncbi:helix-turn-helix domain-containing protein [Kocuria sp.]|uniref:helix-turn-helix domain-containing protein n=1 Tax=Kocuria sp. TaxID=1871328 RepID=UPI0026DCE32F|nr:helix-turn-helix domain-containing protein [Kocuria sp.]MDO4919899.1 helix-turn-helix domain-containing protein [Kocuria sp.]
MIAPLDPASRLTTSESAEYLGVRPQTMANWRSAGTGPPFYKIGAAVQYRVADLDTWIEAQKIAA